MGGDCGPQQSGDKEAEQIDALGRCLTTILGHKASQYGLEMRPDGYVALESLLQLTEKTSANRALNTHSVEDVFKAMARGNEQQFGVEEESGVLWIRAIQGNGIQAHEPTFGLLDEHMAPVDVYSCDDFRMYEFKVRRCMRGRSHDWTECPFAHPGEKARRRDPRKFHYSGTACPDFRKGTCRRGDVCEYAHGVFECWLHPARYRTQACKDGLACKRRVCFFAHTREQLRVLPAAGGGAGTGAGATQPGGGGMGTGSAAHYAASAASSGSGQSLVSPRSAPRCCGVNGSSPRHQGKVAMGEAGRQPAGCGSVAASTMAAAMALRAPGSLGLGLSVPPESGFEFMSVSSGRPGPNAGSPTSTLPGHLGSASPLLSPSGSSSEQSSSPRCQPRVQQMTPHGQKQAGAQWADHATLAASAGQASMAMSGGLGSSVAGLNQAHLRKQHLERLLSLPALNLSRDSASAAAFIAQTAAQQARMAQMFGPRANLIPSGQPGSLGLPSASLAEVMASLSNMDISSASPLWLQAHLTAAAAAHQQQAQAAQLQAAAAEAAALASVQQAMAAPAMGAAFMSQYAPRPPVHAPAPASAAYWPDQNPFARRMPSWEDGRPLEDAGSMRVESGAGIRHKIFEHLLHGQDPSAAVARSPSDPNLNSWVADLIRGAEEEPAVGQLQQPRPYAASASPLHPGLHGGWESWGATTMLPVTHG